MSNPWKKVAAPVQNLSDIMSEELAKTSKAKEDGTGQLSASALEEIQVPKEIHFDCDSDSSKSTTFQCQSDNELMDLENKPHGNGELEVSHNLPDSDYTDEDVSDEEYWNMFNMNHKKISDKHSQNIQDGDVLCVVDSNVRRRTAASLRSKERTSHVATSKVPNCYYKVLHRNFKTTEREIISEIYLAEPTRVVLSNLIDREVFNIINSFIHIHKNLVVLNASVITNPDLIRKEYSVKIFKNTLNDFKTYRQYIKMNYELPGTLSEHNTLRTGHIRAEIEVQNIKKMQAIGLNCPEVICLETDVLVLSFIGENCTPAPKLNDVLLRPGKWQWIYDEVVQAMHKLYNQGNLVHENISPHNIVLWEKKCWFVNVIRFVRSDYRNARNYLYRACKNVTNFFKQKGVPKMESADELFKTITSTSFHSEPVELEITTKVNTAPSLNPWKKETVEVPVQNLSYIMSEEFAKRRHVQDEKSAQPQHTAPEEIQLPEQKYNDCVSDSTIAKVLQSQFDDELAILKCQSNENAKVAISFNNVDDLVSDSDLDSFDEDDEIADKEYWDSYVANDKQVADKQSQMIKDGEVLSVIENNAKSTSAKVGPKVNYDARLILPNGYCVPRPSSRTYNKAGKQIIDDIYLTEPTRRILSELIDEGVINIIHSVIRLHTKFVVLYASLDGPDIDCKEYSIKVFKNSSNGSKGYRKYIETNYELHYTFAENNALRMGDVRAEIEMQNMVKMRAAGLNCPDVVCLKGHVLVTSFIGRNGIRAPKLKESMLKSEDCQWIYDEVEQAMRKLYDDGNLMQGNISAHNILLWQGKGWIDNCWSHVNNNNVARLVLPGHPSAQKSLYNSCKSISKIFMEKGGPKVKTAEELYKSITGFEPAVTSDQK